MTPVLDAIDASRHLRITPELLYQYVRYGAKGRGGRRLKCVPDSAARLFLRSELDDYDAWLREPWAEPDASRKDLPQCVRDYLKVESGGICPLCRSTGPFKNAHIEAWRLSRSNHHHNLLRVCGPCHDRYDDGQIPQEEFLKRKQEAIARVQAHLARPVSPTWPIRNAPPLVRELVGRSGEMEAVTDALRSGRSLSIEGVGGIGKTQLLLHALRSVADGRPVLWLSVDAIGRYGSLEESLSELAKDLGIGFHGGRPMFDEARACVVFDGIERLGADRDAVADLLEELLDATHNTLIVATTQIRLARLEFDETVSLGPLSDENAREILEAGAREVPSALLAFADGHPLTLRLLQILLRYHGSAETVLVELHRRGVFAVEDPQRRRQTVGSSLNACLELAYANLGAAERRLLWMIAVSPGGFRPNLHALAGFIGVGAVRAAADLRSWYLVDQQEDEDFEAGSLPHVTLSMLSPVRSFVLATVSSEASADVRERTLSFCRGQMLLSTFIQNGILRGGDIPLGRELMKRELPNSLSAFDLAALRVDNDADFLPIVMSIAHSTMMTLFTSGAFSTGAAVMRRAASIAAANGSLVDALQFLYQMQTLAFRAMDLASAAAALLEAERIASGASGEPEAMLLLMRAAAAEVEGRYEQAIDLARLSYDLFGAVGWCDEERRKSAGFKLARSLEFSGRAVEALPYYRDALECVEADGDPINRGSILHHIGNCEAYAESYQAAMHAYRKAAEQFVELESTEFISNAVGEAGLIVSKLDPLIGLPGRAVMRAALDDVVEQLAILLSTDRYGGRDPRVTMRKLLGIVTLAIHQREEELLARKARELHARFIAPLDGAPEPPDWLIPMLMHVQWSIGLFQLLAVLSRPGSRTSLRPTHVTLIAWLTARCFFSLETTAAECLVSYLRRCWGCMQLGADDLLAIMETEGDREALRRLRLQAKVDGVDLGWLS